MKEHNYALQNADAFDALFLRMAFERVGRAIFEL